MLAWSAPGFARTSTLAAFYTAQETLDAAPVEGADGNYYATTTGSGEFHYGSIVRITPAGTVTTLYSFTGGADGKGPVNGLVPGPVGLLYGATSGGGSGDGTLFRISTTGVFEKLAVFETGEPRYSLVGKLVVRNDGSVYGLRLPLSEHEPMSDMVLFKYSPSSGLRTLATISTFNGVLPRGLVADAQGNLYGSSYEGYNAGAKIFRCSPTGKVSQQPADLPAMALGSDGRFYGIGDLKPMILDSATFQISSLPRLYPTSARPFYRQSGGGPLLAMNGSCFGLLPIQSEFSMTSYWPNPSSPITKWYPTWYSVFYRLDSDGTFTSLKTFNSGETFPFDLSATASGALIGAARSSSSLEGSRVVTVSPADGTVSNVVTLGFSSNGATPNETLAAAADGGFLGTTHDGGAFGCGTLFYLSKSGDMTVIYDFAADAQLSQPVKGLIAGGDGKFYGLTGNCEIFRYQPGGSVEIFASPPANSGSFIDLPLPIDGGFLVPLSSSRIVKIGTDGAAAVITVLNKTSDGESITGSLVSGADGYYYGVCRNGGTYDMGTFFRVTSEGTLTILAHFPYDGYYTHPVGSLVRAGDGNFYGISSTSSSSSESSNVFRMDPAGKVTILSVLGLVTSPLSLGADGLLYGASKGGFPNGNGGIFTVAPSGEISFVTDFPDSVQGPGKVVPFGDGTGLVSNARGGPLGWGSIISFDPAADAPASPTPFPATSISGSSTAGYPTLKPPHVPGVGKILTSLDEYVLRGTIASSELVAEYKFGPGGFKPIPGGPLWKIRLRLKPGRNVIQLRTHDLLTATVSRSKKIVVIQK